MPLIWSFTVDLKDLANKTGFVQLRVCSKSSSPVLRRKKEAVVVSCSRCSGNADQHYQPRFELDMALPERLYTPAVLGQGNTQVEI